MCYEKYVDIADLQGLVFDSVTRKDYHGYDAIYFENAEKTFILVHIQDCCEYVYIDDIVGDLEDLVGVEILSAEESYSYNEGEKASEHDESYTWTFYKFATQKGRVTVKFYGSSNGYYSESASVIKLQA